MGSYPSVRFARSIYALPSTRTLKWWIRRFRRYGHIRPFRRKGGNGGKARTLLAGVELLRIAIPRYFKDTTGRRLIHLELLTLMPKILLMWIMPLSILNTARDGTERPLLPVEQDRSGPTPYAREGGSRIVLAISGVWVCLRQSRNCLNTLNVRMLRGSGHSPRSCSNIGWHANILPPLPSLLWLPTNESILSSWIEIVLL